MNTKVAGTAPGERQLNGPQTSGRDYRNLSEPRFDMIRENNVPITLRDGTVLLADVFRPDSDSAFPVLVAFSAYPRQMQDLGAPMGFIEAGASDFFVPRGYVHIIVSARGISGSGGEWSMLDQQERDDIHDVVEWSAVQPWSTGDIGMIGISYFAIAQIAAASTRPPHLKAIFPVALTTDMYEAVYHHGVLSSGFISSWLTTIGILAGVKDETWRSRRVDFVHDILNRPAIHAHMQHMNGESIMAIMKNVVRAHAPEEPYGRLLLEAETGHPTRDEFWEKRDMRPGLADIDIPVYLGCDWDNAPLHLPTTFTAWKALRHNPNVRMTLLGSHGLTWPWESLHVEALAWFDHWLKDADTGILDGPAIRYVMPGTDAWRTAEVWPPAETTLTPFALRADGTLAQDEGDAGSREYLYLPADSGRPKNANAPEYPNLLQWALPVPAEGMEFVGDIELQLDATITALDTAWMIVLEDVDADGTAETITAGWQRAMLRTVNEAASTPGAPAIECITPTAITPGELVRYRISIVPNARHLEPGHTLRLTISSEDEAKDIPTALGFTHTPAAQSSLNTIHSSSRLMLPIVRS
ncbi:MAG: peptidase [Subtercola sp.]|nr:peptidase [Subtercola sp.]